LTSRLLISVLAVFTVTASWTHSGQLTAVLQQPQPLPFPTQPVPEDEERIKVEKDMAKKANHARHEDIKRDTDQLLTLATELKQNVDKSNENMLSLDVIKKADEIEKLAHNVKEKMRGSY